ncbi:hypothetical protein A2526_00515 [candidate division WOR-1 bacterium RIFOXYD2_FULL_36_8]|uniref:Type II secretion system protein GspF domain-containing protein n=1 Tax=candidate division WOR-1 bacterium RIFOXYB2_FULL_36_35 TaxID=1802578 RepID=A0A1F4S5V7_UNCSA|nr:MAG: hypothetical protein A2230_02280 [candidate division WOR-1 bacterium RIFOXYA2_FULL_36_21]OGC15821.1 MAG: hypothetical protein A2290_05745 [candidate division WOR-1 bacterium RIFOXYB2_FULL_36_35]OGC15917.1 MAG: hypothetical protein A2282_04965 [candidate division WOR-1 bacterium RIFOXYA12_FULL_36_13]OGC41685.1 MAG: hypothetical protein A2526_00515 [candidate division WOR-1 bacterium RIFOXYD2_FULL_36_8]
MAKFTYKAKDQHGITITGEMESSSSDAVASRLKVMKCTPILISKEEALFSDLLEKYFSGFQKVKLDELIVFVRQLSSILAAGVPLLESLDAVYEQVQSPRFKKIILDMRHNIEGGASFSDALSNYSKVFGPIFISMVKSGERAGILGEVLERLANLLEKDFENMQKIKSAMRYPIIVLFALGIAFVVVITFVIPQFSKLYSSFKTELPLPTRILLGINYVIVNYWLFIILGLIGFVVLIKKILDTDQGRLLWDKIVLSLPIFGQLINKLILARFSRMLAAMLKSGIPIVEALNISKDTIENRILSDVVIKVKEEVVQGGGLTDPIKNAKVFPPLVVQMVAIGEKSGSLEQMLSKVADYFDRDSDYTIRNLTPLIEPLLILMLAFLVVLLALGVFLPMWDMVKLVQT